MITQWTSSGEIIARVIRNTAGQLPGIYIPDMPEWIDEAMRQLQTKWQMEKVSSPCYECPEAIVTKQYVAQLPCGLSALLAVEDKYGNRIRMGSAEIDLKNPTVSPYTNNLSGRATNFQMDSSQVYGADPAVSWSGSDLTPIDNNSVNAFYQIQGNKIQTSEEEMFVRLHYLKVPIDDTGFPLVPDNENYKQALFYYIMKQLIAAGYKHPIWNGPPGYNYCNSEFERFAGRAIAEINYPTIDEMETLRVAWAERLIFPYSKWEDFSIGYEQYQGINSI